MVISLTSTVHLYFAFTTSEIKEMKKQYAEKKISMKKRIQQMLKEDGKRLEAINKSGRNMIEYLKNENEKLMMKQAAMENEYRLLEKQLDLLTQKSEEISKNFSSLQGYVSRFFGSNAACTVVRHCVRTRRTTPLTTVYVSLYRYNRFKRNQPRFKRTRSTRRNAVIDICQSTESS